jgi:hypothetical protein
MAPCPANTHEVKYPRCRKNPPGKPKKKKSVFGLKGGDKKWAAYLKASAARSKAHNANKKRKRGSMSRSDYTSYKKAKKAAKGTGKKVRRDPFAASGYTTKKKKKKKSKKYPNRVGGESQGSQLY